MRMSRPDSLPVRGTTINESRIYSLINVRSIAAFREGILGIMEFSPVRVNTQYLEHLLRQDRFPRTDLGTLESIPSDIHNSELSLDT